MDEPREVGAGMEPAGSRHGGADTIGAETADRRDDEPRVATVRREDLEPHEGLRYIARLFKILSVFLILLLIGEIAIGLIQVGTASVATLLVEATRLIVFAAFLWGAGDIALMLIESNHDLRATRILMGRLNNRMQRLTEMEADELELLAANPSLTARRRRGGPPRGPSGT